MMIRASVPFTEKSNDLRRVWHDVFRSSASISVRKLRRELPLAAPLLLRDMMLKIEPERPWLRSDPDELFEIGEPIIAQLEPGEVGSRLLHLFSWDTMTFNPLGEEFECAWCNVVCDAVLDRQFGVFRNEDEQNAVLWEALRDRQAVRRSDFCSLDCVEQWRQRHPRTRWRSLG